MRKLMLTPIELKQKTDEAVQLVLKNIKIEAERQQKENDRKQHEIKLKAEKIIDEIPMKCAKAAENQQNHAIIMNLEREQDYTNQFCTDVLDPKQLKNAGLIVYDTCKNAGLNPIINYWYEIDGYNSGFNIVIKFM